MAIFTGAILSAIFMVATSFAGCERLLVVISITACMGFMGLWYPGMKVNPLDLSPHYASSIMAISNGVGSVIGIAAPFVVGLLTPNVSPYFNRAQNLYNLLYTFLLVIAHPNGMAIGVLDFVCH